MVVGAIRISAPIVYHIVVVALSAGIALSLPSIVSVLAGNLLAYWSLIENEKIFLIFVEITVAILLIFFFNFVGRSWKDRKIAKMARAAGISYVSPGKRALAGRKVKKLKEKQGIARDVLVIGSTGFRTFVDPEGDLHKVVKNCREAKIMLLDPHSEGAGTRAKAILHPDVSLESFREQILKTIDFLKGLKRAQKNVKLKLYQDTPFLKLAVMGDHIWMQHYHAGLDVATMQEFMFEHNQNPASLFTPFYQYFLAKWESPDIPEYDLETDMLIYRDKTGDVVRRERFNKDEVEVS
ncbi:MAG: hypothetical protein ACREQA_01855 [Candidatus Binatia bacterium]